MFSVIFLHRFSNLQKTSYIKMLDIWMLFSLFLPFSQVLILVFVNHTEENNQPLGKSTNAGTVNPLNSTIAAHGKWKKVEIIQWVGRTVIPILAILFAVSFFGVGLFIYANYEDFMGNVRRC